MVKVLEVRTDLVNKQQVTRNNYVPHPFNGMEFSMMKKIPAEPLQNILKLD